MKKIFIKEDIDFIEGFTFNKDILATSESEDDDMLNNLILKDSENIYVCIVENFGEITGVIAEDEEDILNFREYFSNFESYRYNFLDELISDIFKEEI